MKEDVADRLLAINRSFYDDFAEEFDASRGQPQPGFSKLVANLPDADCSLLDVGCGNGRFGQYLLDQDLIVSYTGVDSSSKLLESARRNLEGEFKLRELSEPGCLKDLGHFDVISCLATLQHIPKRSNRLRLIGEIAQHLNDDGLIFLSTWQFLDSSRQSRKVVEWTLVSLCKEDLEPNDYLLTWQSGGYGLRYVALIEAEVINSLANSAGLTVSSQFRSDGKEGNLNLYSVLKI